MNQPPNQLRTSRSASLFLLSAAWLMLSLAVGLECMNAVAPVFANLVRYTVSAGLLLAGYYFLAKMWVPDMRPLSSIGFVRRPGTLTEFGIGAAFGWGIAIVLILPALLTGNLSMSFAWDATAWSRLVVSLIQGVAYGLTVQLVLAGLPMRLLLRATGPAWAATATIFVACLLALIGETGEGGNIFFVALAIGLFSVSFFRTRAIWLPLGMQIGWTVSLEILFGAQSPYTPQASGIAQSDVGGPFWLTGAPFGPEASRFALLVIIASFPILYRLTRDYAWHYTYQPLVGMGYAMDVPPPEAHKREEQKAAAAQPLVQIGGIAPAPPVPVEPHEK